MTYLTLPGAGMAALAAKIHGMGLKMGVYTDLSNRTVGKVCGTGPGSYGHYEADTKTFAAAGADFRKSTSHLPGVA